MLEVLSFAKHRLKLPSNPVTPRATLLGGKPPEMTDKIAVEL